MPAGVSRRWLLRHAARAGLGAAAFSLVGAAQPERVGATPAMAVPPRGVHQAVIGRSLEGRTLEVWELGAGPISVLVLGGLHTGQERFSADLTADLAAYFRMHRHTIPATVRLHIIPNANPDGYALGHRTNARGVNLNRNWDGPSWRADACYAGEMASGGAAPLSEPETAAIARYIDAVTPALSIAYHAQGALVESNGIWPARLCADAYAAVADYTSLQRYSDAECVQAFGTRADLTGQWLEAMHRRRLAAFDVELSTFTGTDWERSLKGLLATLRALAPPGAPPEWWAASHGG